MLQEEQSSQQKDRISSDKDNSMHPKKHHPQQKAKRRDIQDSY